MASLFKPHIVRYLDAEGRQVRKGTPGARRVKQKAAKWYGQYTDGDGRRRRVPLHRDKEASRQRLAQLVRGVERKEVGMADPFAEHRDKSVAAHVADFEAYLRNKGVCDQYQVEHVRRLRCVLDHGKVRKLGDIRPEFVEQFLLLLADRGTGATMRNNYLASAKAFTRWCVERGRLGEDPLAKLKRTKGELRRQRRALTEDELARLLRTARERPFLDFTKIRSGPRKGQRVADTRRPETRAWLERLGWERSLIYKTLVYTGLRRGELEALEVRHLTLTGRRPCLVLPPAATKNRKGADLPLKADLARDLAEWIAATGKAGADRVFKVSEGLDRILRRDLKAAGIAQRDEMGRTVDVHALRHTTATYLGRAKVTPRVAQGFMRHADIRLTMQTYTDPRLLDEAEALAALPDLPLREDAEGEGRTDKSGSAAG